MPGDGLNQIHIKRNVRDFRGKTLTCLRCELSSGPREGGSVSLTVLSFPDASGSTRSELSSPLDSGFHPPCVLLRVLQSTTAKTSAPDHYHRRSLLLLLSRQTRRGCSNNMNPRQDTKTPSYVTTDKYPRVGAAERRKRRTHEAVAARTGCAPIRRTILLSPHALLLPARITPPPTGCRVPDRHPLRVFVRSLPRSR